MARILCIEDDSELLQIMCEELSEVGHEVLQATGECAGLEMIVNNRPDLIVSDISMPGMNGYVLLKTLRQKHPEFAETPFIFLSALADRDHLIDGLELGADDYLTKPIDYDLLIARVEARLRQTQRMLKKKQEDTARLVEAYKRTAVGKAPESESDLTWK
jgi:DNA-binding response OmpR family regulator